MDTVNFDEHLRGHKWNEEDTTAFEHLKKANEALNSSPTIYWI